MVLHRRDAIVLKAIEIIDESGLQGLSTREIARRVGISEGTIFKHYKSKNEVLLAVLEHFSAFDDEIIKTINLRKKTPKEAIVFFIGSYVEYYENYPAITALIELYNELANNSELSLKVKGIYNNRFGTIRDIIKEAQKNGLVSNEVDCESLSDVINGLFRSICLRWRFSGNSFSLKETTLQTLSVILDAFVKD